MFAVTLDPLPKNLLNGPWEKVAACVEIAVPCELEGQVERPV
jgi:hypothetical protein